MDYLKISIELHVLNKGPGDAKQLFIESFE